MNTKDNRILQRCKRNLERRLDVRTWSDQPKPMLSATNVRYEMSDRVRAISCGGIGAFLQLAQRVGLVDAIDRRLHLLKRYLPYHESDHVLNIAFNTLAGGTCLDDIEWRRQDEVFLDALGAERIPDPTTAGDFTRRFSEQDVVALMDAANEVRVKLWRERLSDEERREAIIDVDGTLAPTTGECKGGMGLSYNGVWGYHPLIVSLSNTGEPIYVANRPGNRPSHDGAAAWMDRGAALAREGGFLRVIFRGDTDFSLTAKFDGWHDEGDGFAFGIDAMPNLVKIAEGLEKKAWKPLNRRIEKVPEGSRRRRPENVKERIVVEKEYENIRLTGETVAEVRYRPTKCKRDYRLVILKKDLSVERGERLLFEDVRHFFYITNLEEMSAEDAVRFANERCDQENLIDQLKNGLNALRMPVGDLVSNWAYMVMASLAWTLKAWFALVMHHGERRTQVLRMEFRRFRRALVEVPAQIVKTGRRIVYRLLGYNDWVRTLLGTFERIRRLKVGVT
ncbi:MAG: IS1380 family transposase [Acidobacteria bacterium]|nr:MAG: IS1380 family transposase [Acidobacteriota bacterium]